MLNEEKIRIMNKLAMYEQGEGKKYLPVSKYYRCHGRMPSKKRRKKYLFSYSLYRTCVRIVTKVTGMERLLNRSDC